MAREEEFVMTPEEVSQCMSSAVLKPFIKDNNVDRKAVENFIMSGDRDTIPDIVSALPIRVRAHLKSILQENRMTTIFRNARELIKQL